jgi:threonine/homoserine/homoserine lactone efflux protein
MGIIEIISFITVATLLVISPGPNGVLIAKTVPLSGRSAGFANISGFVAAFYVHGSLSILGISVLLVQSAEAFFIFKMAGAAYLCWVGVKSLWSAWQNQQVISDMPQAIKVSTKKKAFLEGFLTNALNPKVSMFLRAHLLIQICLSASAYAHSARHSSRLMASP